jgi:hypothetical protein
MKSSFLLQTIRNDSSFSSLQKDDRSIERLTELDKHFLPSKEKELLVILTSHLDITIITSSNLKYVYVYKFYILRYFIRCIKIVFTTTI